MVLLFVLIIRRPPRSTLFPYTTLSRSTTGIRARMTASLLRGAGERLTRLQRDLGYLIADVDAAGCTIDADGRSEEHTSELQSRQYLVRCVPFDNRTCECPQGQSGLSAG